MWRSPSLIILLLVSILFNTLGVVQWGGGAPYDTAHKGIETIEELLQGNIEPFYRHYNGQPPLMDWALAPFFLFFGVSAYTLHAVGIFSGILITYLLYQIGKLFWSSRAGVYASLFGTTSHWVLLETREGTHNIPLVPMLLGVIYCIGLLFYTKTEKIKYISAFIAGVIAGLMGYMYAAGFIFPVFFSIIFPCMVSVAFFKKSWSRLRLPLIVMTTTMFIALFPIVQYSMHDKESVLARPTSEIGTSSTGTLLKRISQNIIPTIGAFTYFNIKPFSHWEENTKLNFGNIVIPFPAPFVSPVGGILFIACIYFIFIRWYQKKSIHILMILLILFIIALIPNLLTFGAQPHYRRAVCAMAPLFLLLGWAANEIHNRVVKFRPTIKYTWLLISILSFTYGPFVYFFLALPSNWYSANYLTIHDKIVPYLFARVAAGQRVTLAGNTAHMKPFQFYALATPQAQHAFHILNLHTETPFPEERISKTDVLFYIYSKCEDISLPGFLSTPTVIKSKLGVDACIFDRPGVTQETIQSRVELPSSDPLLEAFLQSKPPLEPHTPFFGAIYGN